jgi:hypothetical protein
MSPAPPRREPPQRGTGCLVDLVLMLGAFAAATLVAELAGAPNLGTALTFGQIAFALAAVFVLLRR